MRNADVIIAELESAGVESLNILKSFMWNVRHDDDHTDELASLKKEIKAVDYIKEHRKPFYVDGKPPTMLDLIDKSNALKSQYNALLSENEAFVLKRDTASKYTRQVKKILMSSI